MSCVFKNRLAYLLGAAGVGLMGLAILGCRGAAAAADAPGVSDSLATAATDVGGALSAAGTATANPVLLGIGSLLTAGAIYLRVRRGTPPAPPV